jgi:cell division protein FtsI (penicillin-binding protein 3)
VNKYFGGKPSKFVDRLYQLGLNQKLGIEIMGEGQPFIKDTDNSGWSNVSLPWMAIGYELTLTPLQILSFYNAVANNGKLVRPMFVKEIRQAGETIKTFETFVIDESIASESTIEKAKILLEGVVKNGTAKSVFKNSPYSVAGKTATVQIVTSEGYNKTNYQASFVGYFPADNPKYSCIVVVNNPTMGSYYGSVVAAPVFREIADKVTATHADIQIDNFNFSNIEYPSTTYGYYPDLKTVYYELGMSQDNSSANDQWSSVTIKNKQASFHSKTQSTNTLPNTVGMTAKDAIYIFEKLGYIVNFKGRGKVYKQSIKAGSPVVKGTEISIYLKA